MSAEGYYPVIPASGNDERTGDFKRAVAVHIDSFNTIPAEPVIPDAVERVLRIHQALQPLTKTCIILIRQKTFKHAVLHGYTISFKYLVDFRSPPVVFDIVRYKYELHFSELRNKELIKIYSSR